MFIISLQTVVPLFYTVIALSANVKSDMWISVYTRLQMSMQSRELAAAAGACVVPAAAGVCAVPAGLFQTSLFRC
jgi:hypothetical protein